MNRPAILREQLPIAFKPGVSVPELGLQDQAARGGRAASILDGSRVLARKHQRFIDAGRDVGESVRNREHSNGRRSIVKAVDCKCCSSDESHLEAGGAVTAEDHGDEYCRFQRLILLFSRPKRPYLAMCSATSAY